MCRFTAYLGPPIRLSALLTEPSHSLIRQSVRAREREEPLNGDGFGVGWYVPELVPEPAVFRSITPAWNNRNLRNLSRVVLSPCIFAHVRAASEGSGIDEANCHPFRSDRHLFMHNGEITGFAQIRRKLIESISDEAFGHIGGNTDSEHVFALFLDELGRRPEEEPEMRMLEALNRAILRLLALVERHAPGRPSFLNLAVTDGDHTVVSRFCSDPSITQESLYYVTDRVYDPGGKGTPDPDGQPSLVVSSERLTKHGGWAAIPPNHLLSFRRGGTPHLVPLGWLGAGSVPA
jgi:ergothioneine biosynthesis protein EgtC